MWAKSGIALVLLAGVHHAQADPAGSRPLHLSLELERHFTSNALDEPRAVSDWYTDMRGSLEREFAIEDGHVKFGFEFNTRTYDTVSIEDDRAAGLKAELFRKLTPRIELRQAISLSISQLGDDLDLGGTFLGTQATKRAIGSDTQLGFDLGSGASFVVGLVAGAERTGRTSFDNPLVNPVRLDPDKDQVQVNARLARQIANFTYGVFAAAQNMRVEKLGFPPLGLGFQQYTLGVDAGMTTPASGAVNVALGLQALRGDQDILRDLRPTYSISFVAPLPKGFELHGRANGRFETADTDDPLASWLNRGELEAFYRLSSAVTLASGIFGQIKENLLFENKENSRGVYLKATYAASPTTNFVVRVDFTRTFKTVFDERIRTADAYVGIQTKW